MCMGGTTFTTTTTSSGPMDFGDRPWVVVQGDCGLDRFCAWSPNYPLQYGNNQNCELAVNDTAASPLFVQHFHTEQNYDKLTVNGRVYHGNIGPSGVTPQASIVWSSDNSVRQSGWMMCMGGSTFTTTMTTSGPVVFGGLPWVVVQGGCGVDRFCAWSPNYPRPYGSSQICKLAVNDTAASPLFVRQFLTETEYDILTINGREYHGDSSFSGPHGVTPNGVIVWSSDHSVEKFGWRICMGGATVTTTTMTSAPVVFGGLPWVVLEGDCGVDRFCAWSPYYPFSYSDSHICKFAVNDTAAAPVTVRYFSTEAGYDTLTINGREYHGTQGPHGVIPQKSMVWSSDNSEARGGWKICMSTASTTLAPTTPTTMQAGQVWWVASGPCTIDSQSQCAQSPNYPQNYGHNEECSISIRNTANVAPITSRHFETEDGFDVLVVNGNEYSGNVGPEEVVPRDSIHWKSNGAVARSGWRICIMDSELTGKVSSLKPSTFLALLVAATWQRHLLPRL